MEQYCVEVELSSLTEEPIGVYVGLATPEARAEANTEYSFFQTEEEARAYAAGYLQEYPGIRHN